MSSIIFLLMFKLNFCKFSEKCVVCLWSLSHIYVNVLLNLSLMYVLCREHAHQIYALLWTVFGWRAFNIIYNSLISKNFQSPAGPYSIPLKPQFTSMGGKKAPFHLCRWYRCAPQARVLYQRPASLGLCAVFCPPLMLYLEFSGATLPISGLQLLLLLITTGTILNFSFHICWCYANKTELNIFEDYSTPFKNNQHEKWQIV